MYRNEHGEAIGKLKVLFFDVNETLLDISNVKQAVAELLDNKMELADRWFNLMLQYTWMETMADRYHDFGEIGLAALHSIAKMNHIAVDPAKAIKAIVLIKEAQPHPDVEEGLHLLHEMDFNMLTLTNSSNPTIVAQLQNSGLRRWFDGMLSIEDIGFYKPHRHVYRWAANRMNVKPSECMLVAAHGWDIFGALEAGYRAAFIERPQQVLYPLAEEPEIIEPDLINVAKRIIELER